MQYEATEYRGKQANQTVDMVAPQHRKVSGKGRNRRAPGRAV